VIANRLRPALSRRSVRPRRHSDPTLFHLRSRPAIRQSPRRGRAEVESRESATSSKVEDYAAAGSEGAAGADSTESSEAHTPHRDAARSPAGARHQVAAKAAEEVVVFSLAGRFCTPHGPDGRPPMHMGATSCSRRSTNLQKLRGENRDAG
jgi:hypothetical protein